MPRHLTTTDVDKFRSAVSEVISTADKLQADMTPRERVVFRMALKACHAEEAYAHGETFRAFDHARGVTKLAKEFASMEPCERVRTLRTQGLKWNDLVALADRLAVKDHGLRHMLREVRDSRWKTREFTGSYRRPSFKELLTAVEKSGREQGLW